MMLRTLLPLLLSAAAAFAGSLDEAKGLIEERKYEEARPVLEKALEDSATEADAVFLLTQACNGLGDWKAGVKHGKRAVKLLPDSSEAHYEYAVALRIKMSNISKVKAMFAIGTYKDELKKAIELDPKNADAIAERASFLANAPRPVGDLDEAEKDVATLEKLDWLLAKQIQVMIEMRREDTPAAIRVAEEILERHPDHAGTRSRVGYLLQGNNQFEAADAQFVQLVENEDEEVALAALYQRGRTRVLGNYQLEEAIMMFESYIDRFGDGSPRLASEAAAFWRIGMAQENLGQPDKARASYGKAIKLEPDFEQARESLKKLNRR